MRTLLLLLALAAKPVTVSSTQLWTQYRADAVKADAKYRDKELVVTGNVRSISATYTVYLEGGQGQVDGVTASPESGQYEAMSKLQVGKPATLICVGAGIVFNEPLLLHCKVH